MVFSSIEFIYLFLPPTLLGFLALRWLGWERGIIYWLVLASLAFYAWWSVPYLVLLMGSVALNYLLHRVLVGSRDSWVLGFGIAGNLAALGYFKYADFFVGNMNLALDTAVPLPGVILPLAISFFTFQQISFLCDTYAGRVKHCDFARYCLFVVFFPQLIAGPIVLQKDTLPQFRLVNFTRHLSTNLCVGVSLFAIGLFKKIVLADSVAPYANTVFGLAETTQGVPPEAAWLGTIAYTFQIYFDFSGYCDMALGLARMFGIRLPINFNSPYKATSIVEFWRRWHITLSRFLRDYLYIPLGGRRRGPVRRHLNLLATMVLGGLWHGASWTFVAWGALHGIYLVINHAWGTLAPHVGIIAALPPWLRRWSAWSFTILAVSVAWVFFRAESFGGAMQVITGMAGFSVAYEPELWGDLLAGSAATWAQFAALTAIVLWLPNSIELTQRYRPVIDVRKEVARKSRQSADPLQWDLRWRPSPRWAAATGVIALVAIVQLYRLADLTEFIYFNF